MKAVWFLILVFLLAGGVLWWRLADVETRVATRFFLKRHWWILPAAFIAMAIALVALSNFSIKVF